MDDNKVQAVLKLPQPNTIKDLQRFLGFTSFYRCFIRHFSTIAAPLTLMLKRGRNRLSWSLASQKSFQHFQQSYTILTLNVNLQ